MSGRAPSLAVTTIVTIASRADRHLQYLEHDHPIRTFACYSSGNATNFIQDFTLRPQLLPTGNCSTATTQFGSCWRVAAVSLIEWHAPRFSQPIEGAAKRVHVRVGCLQARIAIPKSSQFVSRKKA